MQYTPFRLDDIARDIFHFAPEAFFELYAPVESPCAATWHEWWPDAHQPWSGMTVRTAIRRLDTQLSPQRWLPDACYTSVAVNTHELWACELQSVARHHPRARASTCLAKLLRQAFPELPEGGIEARALEVRTVQSPRITRPLPQSKAVLRLQRAVAPSAAVQSTRDREGLCRFEPSDALCTLDPLDRRFSHPRYWPFVCLSQRVTADHLSLRLARLVELEKTCSISFTEVRLLLGCVGRVRFPKDSRFASAMEHTMNESAALSALDFGHMTEEERHRILLDANERQTRLYEERLKEAERKGLEEGERRGLVDGERRGLEEGERRGLLAAARAVLSLHRSASEVDSAISALEQCTGNDEIKVALTSLLR
ncbi:MAG: hypothetical protein KGO50_09910 [Myxococcales bacterium]|nr:hypothetical protein [Myxococcales bacterium]